MENKATSKRSLKNKKTKISKILDTEGLTQNDLYYLIQAKTGKTIGLDRICKIVNGKLNYTIATAKILAKTLNVGLDDIVD